jgi:D-arabinose 1-dehydrogenase-like Zn-dependent alcohol dehydrogenase
MRMKAAVVVEPGKLVVEEVPEPEPGPYDALCRNLFGATCVGTDLHIINNQFPWPVKYPTLLGHETVGRVVKIGAKVRHYRVGDLISRTGNPQAAGGRLTSTWGGFAQFGLARDHRSMKEDGCPESEWRSSRVNQVIPAGIDPAAATMMITWRETFSFISRMGMKSGKSLLVLGSGGNGIAFAAHAKNLGACAVAMTGSSERREGSLRAGATDYYSYKDGDIDSRLKRDFPDGFDFIIDAIGKAGLLDQALAHCARDGRVAHYGLDDYGKWSLNPSRARGTFTYFAGGYDEAEAHEAVVGFMLSGKLDARHWLNLENAWPLERIAEAYDSVQKRREVKAVVKL